MWNCCCEYKDQSVEDECCPDYCENRRVKGRFGLAFVAETPCCCPEPIGWQVEFCDTPSKVEQRCREMVQWANCPPLPRCEPCPPVEVCSPCFPPRCNPCCPLTNPCPPRCPPRCCPRPCPRPKLVSPKRPCCPKLECSCCSPPSSQNVKKCCCSVKPKSKCCKCQEEEEEEEEEEQCCTCKKKDRKKKSRDASRRDREDDRGDTDRDKDKDKTDSRKSSFYEDEVPVKEGKPSANTTDSRTTESRSHTVNTPPPYRNSNQRAATPPRPGRDTSVENKMNYQHNSTSPQASSHRHDSALHIRSSREEDMYDNPPTLPPTVSNEESLLDFTSYKVQDDRYNSTTPELTPRYLTYDDEEDVSTSQRAQQNRQGEEKNLTSGELGNVSRNQRNQQSRQEEEKNLSGELGNVSRNQRNQQSRQEEEKNLSGELGNVSRNQRNQQSRQEGERNLSSGEVGNVSRRNQQSRQEEERNLSSGEVGNVSRRNQQSRQEEEKYSRSGELENVQRSQRNQQSRQEEKKLRSDDLRNTPRSQRYRQSRQEQKNLTSDARRNQQSRQEEKNLTADELRNVPRSQRPQQSWKEEEFIEEVDKMHDNMINQPEPTVGYLRYQPLMNFHHYHPKLKEVDSSEVVPLYNKHKVRNHYSIQNLDGSGSLGSSTDSISRRQTKPVERIILEKRVSSHVNNVSARPHSPMSKTSKLSQLGKFTAVYSNIETDVEEQVLVKKRKWLPYEFMKSIKKKIAELLKTSHLSEDEDIDSDCSDHVLDDVCNKIVSNSKSFKNH